MRYLIGFMLLGLAFFPTSVHARAVEPIRLTPCQLLSDPARYNHALVEISGYVSQGFENFSMEVKDCPSQKGFGLGIWLKYGGTRRSGTKYCCEDDSGPDRSSTLVVEGVRCDLIQDAALGRFGANLAGFPTGAANATIVGRFFAGQYMRLNQAHYWGGFGHMGGFTMIVIERVLSSKTAALRPEPKSYPTISTDPLPVIDPASVRP